jgi:hypothetical protein
MYSSIPSNTARTGNRVSSYMIVSKLMRLLLILAIVSLGVASDFSTYLGDARQYRPVRVLSDSAGNTYVAGTQSRAAGKRGEFFVTELDPAGAILLTASFDALGTDDHLQAFAIDTAGNLYLAGYTDSVRLPLMNAVQSERGTGTTTGFLVKLSPNGTRVLFSSYFGGKAGGSSVQAIAVDRDWNMYLTGGTHASDYPVTPGLPQL